MIYLYKSHLGGFYVTEEPMENTYCEECGDFDSLILSTNSIYEVGEVLRGYLDVFELGGYNLEYLQSVYNEAKTYLEPDEENNEED